MAELETEVWRFNDWEPVLNVVVFLCSDFAKREDKNILNQLSFIPFLYKDYNWIIKIQSSYIKEKRWEKALFEKERHFHGNPYTEKRNIETEKEQEATSSSSRAKELQDSSNYSTSIVDKQDQDDYYYS